MFFSILLLAISLSIDAFGLGIAYGLRKIKFPIISMIIICLFSFFYSTLALFAGQYISCIISTNVSKYIGISILFSMGLWIIRNPLDVDINDSGCLHIKESILLSLALSIDSIGVGVASALSGLISLLVPLFTGIFQFLFLLIGTTLGKKLLHPSFKNKKILSILPGLILILFAILRLF